MEQIVGVALRDEHGVVHSLPKPNRHNHVIGIMVQKGIKNLIPSSEQGFVTDQGRFLGRAEALELALSTGQVAAHRRSVPELEDLFSEDLW